MSLSRIVYHVLCFALPLGALLASLDAVKPPQLKLEIDLSESVNRDILSKMTPDEIVLFDSVLFYGDPATKGSIAWLERELSGDLPLNRKATMAAEAALIVFLYPEDQIIVGPKCGIIFANVHNVEDQNSKGAFTEWFNIGRLSREGIKFPRVNCRLIFWFSTERQGSQTQELFCVTEEFELREHQWHLLTIRKNIAD